MRNRKNLISFDGDIDTSTGFISVGQSDTPKEFSDFSEFVNWLYDTYRRFGVDMQWLGVSNVAYSRDLSWYLYFKPRGCRYHIGVEYGVVIPSKDLPLDIEIHQYLMSLKRSVEAFDEGEKYPKYYNADEEIEFPAGRKPYAKPNDVKKLINVTRKVLKERDIQYYLNWKPVTEGVITKVVSFDDEDTSTGFNEITTKPEKRVFDTKDDAYDEVYRLFREKGMEIIDAYSEGSYDEFFFPDNVILFLNNNESDEGDTMAIVNSLAEFVNLSSEGALGELRDNCGWEEGDEHPDMKDAEHLLYVCRAVLDDLRVQGYDVPVINKSHLDESVNINTFISFDDEDVSTGHVNVGGNDPFMIHIEKDFDNFPDYFYGVKDLLEEYDLLYDYEENPSKKYFQCVMWFADNEELPLHFVFEKDDLSQAQEVCFNQFKKGVLGLIRWIHLEGFEDKYPATLKALEFMEAIIEGTTINEGMGWFDVDTRYRLTESQNLLVFDDGDTSTGFVNVGNGGGYPFKTYGDFRKYVNHYINELSESPYLFGFTLGEGELNVWGDIHNYYWDMGIPGVGPYEWNDDEVDVPDDMPIEECMDIIIERCVEVMDYVGAMMEEYTKHPGRFDGAVRDGEFKDYLHIKPPKWEEMWEPIKKRKESVDDIFGNIKDVIEGKGRLEYSVKKNYE